MVCIRPSLQTFKCGKPLVGVVALLLCATSALAQRTALSVDTAASQIYAVTHRSGLLKFLGHEHVITATRWSAELCLDRSAAAQSYAKFVIDTRALIIDADSARQLAGLGGGPSRNQRAEIQAKMLDAKHLNAEAFPELRFESTSITLKDGRELQVQGNLTMRGVTQPLTFPATLQPNATGHLMLAAKITVKQSAFGLKPESIAGVVKVSDPVDLHVRLTARETTAVCR
jgi:polyisoprenoid-binding protein YceI